MNDETKARDPQAAKLDATRTHHEFFCIYSYAGESGPPCGWRGVALETVRNPKTWVRPCPRCGRATLMELRGASAETQ